MSGKPEVRTQESGVRKPIPGIIYEKVATLRTDEELGCPRTGNTGPALCGIGSGERKMDTVSGALCEFNHSGNSLAHADAHRREAVTCSTTFHFVHERGHDSCSAASERMP